MSTTSDPSATTTAGGNGSSDTKPCYTMDRFLTEASSPTEKLCSKAQGKTGGKGSHLKRVEAMGQYIDQWQSSWEAKEGGAGSISP